MSDTTKQRTQAQNRSLHLYCTQVAEALNDAGYDVRATLKEGVEIPWSGYLVKDLLWRSIQKLQYGKASTTELTTKNIDSIYDVLNRHLGEKFGIHVPFPSIESMMEHEEA